ncbi:MAG: gamma-glutamyl-gamma-aminobutyrate hydrolase family protein [Candidatus Dormibacteraceae bacterium]
MSTPRGLRVLITAGATTDARHYEEAVEASGAEPLVARPGGGRPSLEHFDALLLTGGPDVAPERFGATVPDALRALVEIEPARDELEWDYLDQAERLRLPMLAICRGLQVLNVHRGGTLHLDLPAAGFTAIAHSRPDRRHQPVHQVRVAPGRLREIVGADDLGVNSTHHQAIREAAPDLRIVAQSADGVIEGVESADGRLIAVQWHPERLFDSEPAARRLFADLLERAAAVSGASR